MTWFFNDEEITASDKYMITFDGTYATLFIASCEMSDMGEYKCFFENSAGSDETIGKVTVKPVSTKLYISQLQKQHIYSLIHKTQDLIMRYTYYHNKNKIKRIGFSFGLNFSETYFCIFLFLKILSLY